MSDPMRCFCGELYEVLWPEFLPYWAPTCVSCGADRGADLTEVWQEQLEREERHYEAMMEGEGGSCGACGGVIACER